MDVHPSDHDEEHLATIEKRVEVLGLRNLRPPLRLNVTEPKWPLAAVDVVYNANMVHIAHWEVAVGLFRGAAQVLSAGGWLVTYGPYKIDGEHTSESNRRFDESLRGRDERWGMRDLAELAKLAARYGLALRERRDMPANNFLVIWDRL